MVDDGGDCDEDDDNDSPCIFTSKVLEQRISIRRKPEEEESGRETMNLEQGIKLC